MSYEIGSLIPLGIFERQCSTDTSGLSPWVKADRVFLHKCPSVVSGWKLLGRGLLMSQSSQPDSLTATGNPWAKKCRCQPSEFAEVVRAKGYRWGPESVCYADVSFSTTWEGEFPPHRAASVLLNCTLQGLLLVTWRSWAAMKMKGGGIKQVPDTQQALSMRPFPSLFSF